MFKYIKSLISADTKERCSAFLAIIAGITLCLGFNILIWQKNKATELGLVTAGLVTLATFSKVDAEPPKEDKQDKQD
jgi:hypothetical protein